MNIEKINEIYRFILKELHPELLERQDLAGIIVRDLPEFWDAQVIEKRRKFYIEINKKYLEQASKYDIMLTLIHEIGHILVRIDKNAKERTISGFIRNLISEAISALIVLYDLTRLINILSENDYSELIKACSKRIDPTHLLVILHECTNGFKDILSYITNKEEYINEILRVLKVDSQEYESSPYIWILAILLATKKFGDKSMGSFIC